MSRLVELWRRLPDWAFGPLLLAFFVLCGVTVGLWYRFVTSGTNRPEIVETCALGSYDQAAFRALIGRVMREGGRGGGGCEDATLPGDCFERVLKERIDAVQKVAGPDMIGRVMAMHAVMRASKAALLSQTTIPPRAEMNFAVFKAYREAFPEQANKPPVVQRAERFVYALDKREVGLSGPALIGAGRRTSWDTGRTGSPSGLYAIAEVTIVLSDPALSYPDDSDTGAVKEEIGYVEAAWTHRRTDMNGARPSLPGDSVHDMTSLCPHRPAWLDTPAVSARKPGEPTAEERRRRLFQWADQFRNEPGRPPTPP
jgi:hypothetical protein